jgi:DNA-binding transcriptional regulator YiaG
VQALRQAYGENTATFAVRFARSRRTIEDWELGRRNPDKLCQRMMDVMAAQKPLDTIRDIAV